MVTSEWDYFFYGLYVLAYPKRLGKLYLLDPAKSNHPSWSYLMPVIPIGTRLPTLPNAWHHVRIMAFDYHNHSMFWGPTRHNRMRTHLQADVMRPTLYRSNYPSDVSVVNWTFGSQRISGCIFGIWSFTQSWILFSLTTLLCVTLFWSRLLPEWGQYRLFLLIVCFYGLEFASQLSLLRLGFGIYITWKLQQYPALRPILITLTLILSI